MGAIEVGGSLPQELLTASVETRDERAVELGSLLRPQPTALVFIRHFGCLGCSVHMADLAPRIGELHELGLEVLLVGNGAARYIEGFIERFHLDERLVTIVTDPSLKTHRAAALRRSFWGTMGPRGILDHLKALISGHSQSGIKGDNWQQGGVVLIDGERKVVYYHRNASLSDHAPTNDLVESIQSLLLARKPLYAEP